MSLGFSTRLVSKHSMCIFAIPVHDDGDACFAAADDECRAGLMSSHSELESIQTVMSMSIKNQ